MLRRSSLAAAGAALLVAGAAASSVPAATHHARARAAVSRTTVARALRPARLRTTPSIERRVNALLRRMTLQEKLEQLTLLSDGQINDAEATKPVGAVFSLVDPVKINQFQHDAVDKSRLHIPILFAYDTIHGYR